ncbi:MAG: 4Fe-4S dicluster domain-containing protein [Clostridia bacterium]|nr:4Fe-4S dicluster domain-containing protein [Clostridia bacterium]
MDLKELMKEAGIVGAGGAGFPSYAKLAEGAHTLLVNGAECEPLLYTDYILLQREMSNVLFGINAVLEYAKIPRALLCVKEHTAKRLQYKDGARLAEKIFLKTLPDVYPMGDEISMIYQATGIVVKPGNLPITAGVIVYNVETLYNVAVMQKFSTKLTMKWLTIAGNIPKPIVVRVPIGTLISDLFEKNSIIIPEGHTVLDGGPSMGKVIDPQTAVVSKTTKGLLILPNETEAIVSKFLDGAKSIARAETACCQCTRCTDLCPRHLLGYPLEPHKMVRTAKGAAIALPEMVLSATLCCGCGLCESLACCQGISPRAVINEYKALLAKNKLRYVAKTDVEVSPEREYRMIPSEKWASVLGVQKYDRVPVFVGEDTGFDRVELFLRQHIGATSVAIVKEGAQVQRGEKIAESGDGLSLPLYASISGYVTAVDNEKIIIDRVNNNV